MKMGAYCFNRVGLKEAGYKTVAVQMSPETIAALETVRARTMGSRAALVELIVRSWLAQDKSLVVDGEVLIPMGDYEAIMVSREPY